MTRYIALAALLSFAIMIQSPPRVTATTVCSGGLPADMTERFQLLAEGSPVIVLAEITASDDVPTEGVSPLIGVAKTATFTPSVVLKAELALEEFSIGPLRATGPDCSGGPELMPGEQALLFLTPQQQYPEVAVWRVGVFGDVVRFDDGNAEYAYAAALGDVYTEPAGTAAEVIETITAVLGTDEETRNAAYAFVGLAPPSVASPTATPPTAAPSGATPGITPPDTGDAGLR